MPERFIEAIRAARSDRPLCIRGGGSKDFYGNPPRGDVLDTRGHAGIIAYEPTELVITARCGTPLAEIETALAGHGQMLAFEPPHFGESATLGGCVASGLSGPRRTPQNICASSKYIYRTKLIRRCGTMTILVGVAPASA